MIYISNAFSINMLKDSSNIIYIEKIPLDEVKARLSKRKFVSAIGHKSTADLLTKILDIEIPFNRVEIKLKKGEEMIAFQIKQRLEEGKILTEEEIKNIPYEFYYVKIL